MTPRAKLALFGVALAGGVAALLATRDASAATRPEPTPEPSPPKEPWPADNMPWMMYSATTLAQQRAFNETAAQTGIIRLIAEDGILGPESCNAFANVAPTFESFGLFWHYQVPIACAGRA